MAENRLAGADFVRAAACLMVVAHHVAQRVSPDVLSAQGTTTAKAVMMGAFGVAAFFVLSGYLLSRPFWVALNAGNPMPSLRVFALRRAARILPGYWLALTVTFLLSFTLLQVPFDTSLLLRYVAGVLLVADFHWVTWFPVEFNGPLWSISCEIASYALLPIGLVAIFALPRGFARWGAVPLWAALIAGLVGLQFLIVRYLQPDDFQRSWEFGLVGGAKVWMPNYNPIGFFAIFMIGALAAGLQAHLARWRSLAFDALALLGGGLAVWSMASHFPETDGFDLGSVPYGFPWFPLGIGLILIGAPSSRLLWRITEIAPIAFIARISFGIYVWHYFLMEIVRVLWQPHFVYAGMTSVTQWAWISAGVVAVSVAIATVSYYWLEAPIIAWARDLERRPSNAAPALSPAAG